MTDDGESYRQRDQDRDRDRDRERDRDRDRDRERDRAREAAVLKIIEKWLPILTLVVGAGWALYQYIDHQKQVERQTELQVRQARDARSFETRKPFLDKQLALYFETTALAGWLAAENDPTLGEWKIKLNRFAQIFFGELPMIASANVQDAMSRTWEAAAMYEKYPEIDKYKDEKKKASISLARAIHDDVEGVWRIK